MNGEAASVDQSKVDKIAAAKRKLREFESRRVNGGDSSSSPVPSIHSNGGGEYVNGRHSVTSVVQPDQEYGIPPSSNNSYSAFDAKAAECEALKKQVAELHGLYSAAYSAYNELAARESGRSSAVDNGQIVQLQSALSLLVEEKTELQSRLRAESERASGMEEQLRRATEHSHAHSHSSREESRLRDQLIHSEKMVAAHLEELSNLRRENATTQSMARGLQQDKAEAQARLRGVYGDKERLEAEVGELRKEMAMREMYIRQLTAANGGGGGVNGQATVQDDSADLRSEVDSLRLQLENTRREAVDSINLYTHREKELSDRLQTAVRERDELSHDLSIARVRVAQLEDDVESARGQIAAMAGRKTGEEGEGNGGGGAGEAVGGGGLSEDEVLARVDETARRITIAFEQRLMEEGEIHQRNVDHKERELAQQRSAIDDLRLKLDLAERKMAEDDGRAGSLHEILQDLQNEKATVSRALTQNRELKEQVIALEDRLVALTDEKLKSELERQALEFELRGMKEGREEEEERDEQGEGNGRMEEEDRVSVREKQLESQLGVQERMLNEVREELRRSQNENDSMNAIMQQNGEDENQNSIVVELTQAVARVNSLTQENNELRERIGATEEMQQRAAAIETQLRFAHQDIEMMRSALAAGGVPNGGVAVTEEQRVEGHESEMIRVLQERLASAEEEAARLLREGVEKVNELNEKMVESERMRRCEEERREEIERKMAELEMVRNQPNEVPAEVNEKEGRMTQLETELEREREERKKLEHVRTALEQENETIADHVVLYQHYRKVMRERLRAKDDELREAEVERQRIAHTCSQLQRSLQALVQQPRLRCGSEGGNSSIVDEEGERRGGGGGE
ncbi:hypothetical protein PFISCL1PPCAC_8068, partial [Pristionchus fissidentatus]